MAKKLAVLTIAVLHEPMGHPRVQGFMDRLDSVFTTAESTDGFIDRSRRDYETMKHAWGEVVVPACFGEIEDMRQVPATLSVWDDLESLAAFAYHGAHGEAMTKRKEWIKPEHKTTYCLWWVDEVSDVNWQDASERLDHLHGEGPTSFAFNFTRLFDEAANPTSLNVQAVRAKATSRIVK